MKIRHILCLTLVVLVVLARSVSSDTAGNYELVIPSHEGDHLYLNGAQIEMSILGKGDEIEQDRILYVPPQSEDAVLEVAFHRYMLTDEFLRRMFLEHSSDFASVHPFVQRGVEAILSDSELRLKIHSGVILNTRAQVSDQPEFRTFRSPTYKGQVVSTQGTAMASKRPASNYPELANFMAAWEPSLRYLQTRTTDVQDDGSVTFTFGPMKPGDAPEWYRPRVISN